MNISEITVINFGSVQFFHSHLDPQITMLKTENSAEIIAAIEIVLCNKNVPSIPDGWLRNNTEISAKVCIDNLEYYVVIIPDKSAPHTLSISAKDGEGNEMTGKYLSLLSHCKEQDTVESFDVSDKAIPLRLSWYRNTEKYKPTGEMENNTEYIATTRFFRSLLTEYIKTFQPEPLEKTGKYNVAINQNGKFNIIRQKREAVHLEQIDEKIFLYICFLNVAEFWSNVESIRNLNYVKKPLLVKNPFESLNAFSEMEYLINRTLMLKRQIVFVTSPT